MKSLTSKLFNVAITVGAFFVIALILVLSIGLFLLRINNYHHAEGVIEHKNQYKLVSQVEGSIQEIFVNEQDSVRAGDTILTYFSERNVQEAENYDDNIRFLKSELNILRKMVKAGSLSPLKIKEKQLEITGLKNRKKVLLENVITAPVDGNISYAIHPQYIRGSYIAPGQVLANIYGNNEKHVRVAFPNIYSDRFKTGGAVVFKYHDPGSLKTAKLTGVVSRKFVDMESNEVHLYCDIEGNRELLERLKASTGVRASILVNSTSMAEDLFKITLDLSILKKWMRKSD